MSLIWKTLFVLLALAATGPAQMLQIDNPHGGVTVEVVRGKIEIQGKSAARRVTQNDVSMSQDKGTTYINVNPPDDVRIDLDIKLPYGYGLRARTKDGPISAKGLFAFAEFMTDTGEVALEAPWNASRLRMMASAKPQNVELPKEVDFAVKEVPSANTNMWMVDDRIPSTTITYGRVRVTAGKTQRVVLRNMPVPGDSPVKLPWQAPEVLNTIAAGQKNAKDSAASIQRQADPAEPEQSSLTADGEALFSSSVRMVNVTAAVYDPNGRPLTGLKAPDFTVLENGVAQDIAFAGAEEVPFNLVLLLDLSGSTKQDRADMKTAALRFLEIARPQDRVAVYALANDRFHVVSTLTNDRERLKMLIEAIPEVSGGTPLYDALVLSYAEELRNHANERNALIILSDGVDNQLQGELTPSEVSFDKLLKTAKQFDAFLYPILLNAGDDGKPKGYEKRARQRMEALAEATGGKLFPAKSLHELDPVYPQVESELRAVYSLAYYPKDQQLDSGWHTVEIKVKQPGAIVRSREGYYGQP